MGPDRLLLGPSFTFLSPGFQQLQAGSRASQDASDIQKVSWFSAAAVEDSSPDCFAKPGCTNVNRGPRAGHVTTDQCSSVPPHERCHYLVDTQSPATAAQA